MGEHAALGPMREMHAATLASPLLDEELWGPALAALRSARTRVDLTQLLFEPDFRPVDVRLTDEIEAAAQRGARVRILVNENAAFPDSYDEIAARFAGTPVEVKPFPMSPNVLHTKLLIVDRECYLVDAPFEQKYADSRAHPFRSARRLDRQPFHAVSLRLEGPVVERLAQMFEALWGRGPLARRRDAAPAPEEVGSSTSFPVELAWTSPAGVWSSEPALGILSAYEEALARAKRFVYLETQYFTSPRMRELVAEALAREPRLEVIMALNERMDLPMYDGWQEERLAELGWPEHPRLGVFSLWSPRRVASDPALRPLYLHSKVAVVDDAWATIGSANLDSISLHESADFGLRVPANVEINACFADAAFAIALRRRLWGEHLGDAGVWRADEPPGGWLAHWRQTAEANLARFHAGEPPAAGRVFPFHAVATKGRKSISRPGSTRQG